MESRNLEERTQEDAFERKLQEERPINKAVVGLVSVAPILTTISAINHYSQGDYDKAIVMGVGTVATGALAFGAYKLYKFLYED